MSYRIIIPVLFLLSSLAGRSQVVRVSDSIVFTGVVLHASTAEPVAGVHCLSGRKGVVTDAGGGFRMTAFRRDTVSFSHVGFKTCRVIIPDTLYEKEYMLGIFLSPDTLLLSEALIVRRFGDQSAKNMATARNNMKGVRRQAFSPVEEMDAGMNQKMLIEEYARSVEMKGHVDVGFGVGTASLAAFRHMRLLERLERDRMEYLKPGEIDMLKKLYYLEKTKNSGK